jgi:D-amino-acid dehydrogenase
VLTQGGLAVTVVGAGMVGLSVAWSLQEEGATVTVLDAETPNSGASWGNAGWFAPGLTTPLPNPRVLHYGLRAAFSASSPLYVPLASSPRTWRWLLSFARHSTASHWRQAQEALSGLSVEALSSLDEMSRHEQSLSVWHSPFTIAVTSEARLQHATAELTTLRSFGQDVSFDLLTAEETRAVQPGLSKEIHGGVRLHQQRFVDPTRFVPALARVVVERGGLVCSGCRVEDVAAMDRGVVVRGSFGEVRSDRAVLATGAALGDLGARFGVRRRVQSGRGYSFSVPTDLPVIEPLYLPDQRIACTPLGGRLRVAGMMEFRPRDARLDPRRVETLAETLRPILPAARLDARTEEWVGARPCTADGLPLIGATRDDRVFVAGGHGMWGVALGPVTGRLLARSIVAGTTAGLLKAFDPLR